MTEIILLAALIVLAGANLWLTFKKGTGSSEDVGGRLAAVDAAIARIDPLIREEFGRNRGETQSAFKEIREELSKSFMDSRKEQGESLKSFEDKFAKSVENLNGQQKQKFDDFVNRLDGIRKEQGESLKSFEDKFAKSVDNLNGQQKQKFDDFLNRLDGIRKEQGESLKSFKETFTRETGDKLKEMREMVEGRLTFLQKDNNDKLEQMRKTVDEKLQESINKRFNESFELISKRLEEVQKGLGEMQTLASDVGGLKKVLTNVKTRGMFGEVQLEILLEQILSPEQYDTQVATKSSSQERVDAAVKLPGQTDDGSALLLPIDSKFPVEDYQRLYDAYEAGEAKEAILSLRKRFEDSVKATAKSISAKYVNPPVTTDFAIMFVPSEGIYAEILRATELFELLRREFRVTVVGPTNLSAFLSSLQMGFRTLAIQQRTSEVWAVLGAVKTEFGKFGSVLDKASKQLDTVAKSISSAGIRTRAIERKLRGVESLPQDQSSAILGEAIELEEEPGDLAENDENE